MRVSHNRMVLSLLALASESPSGENTTQMDQRGMSPKDFAMHTSVNIPQPYPAVPAPTRKYAPIR